MISFRLSADEYERFRELCSTCGTRSVSELARAAINSLLKAPVQVPSEALASQLAELEGRVNMLRLELAELRQREGSLVSAAPTANLPAR
jgi:hypothetical protein